MSSTSESSYNITLHTRLGKFIVPRRLLGDSIVVEMAAGNLLDWRIAEAMVRYWVHGTDILDVGGNLGQMSVCVETSIKK
jgi:hypothetical protein